MMAPTPKYKEMTASSRQSALILLNSHVKDGVLEKGWLAQTAKMFSVMVLLKENSGANCVKKIALPQNCCCC
jgi:hypothetical protein